MSEVNTKTMNRQELESTAKDIGLSFPHNISDEKLRARIDEALGGAPVKGGSDIGAAAQTAPEAPAATAEKRYEIIIATHDQDKQAVPVGVNGKTWLIKRGEKVIVPECVVENLRNAVQFQYDPATMERTEVMSYPFQVLREVA